MTEVNAEAQTTTTTPAEAEQIAFRFINGYFQNAGRDHPRISIPADPLHDDDILLLAFIRSSSSALAQLRQAREEVEKALACFSVMPEASPHDKKGGIWDTWTDGCNYLKSALTTTAPKETP